MIDYSDHNYVLGIVCQRTGSVLPQALVWALSNALFAGIAHWAISYISAYMEQNLDDFKGQMDGVTTIWSGYTAVLGFLIVFRNNQAYSRFWEGATLVNQTRGEWFNAVSSLIAFCDMSEARKTEVEHFQALLVRLASLLHCSALQEVCEIEDASLEILDPTGLEQESMAFLEIAHDRCEIIMQWLQRLIMVAHKDNVLIAPPPILSRSFQELSRGVVNLNNVRKIRDIPFPFPYNQVLVCMLAVHWIVTPLIAAFYVSSIWWACAICFFVTGGLWCVIYIAKEIDQPFGEDPNDLPMVEMQRDFNRSLSNLMEPLAQRIPDFVHDKTRQLKITGRYEAPTTSRTSQRVSRFAEKGSDRQEALIALEESFGRQVTPLSDAFSNGSTSCAEKNQSALQEVIMEEPSDIDEDEQLQESDEADQNVPKHSNQKQNFESHTSEMQELESLASSGAAAKQHESEGSQDAEAKARELLAIYQCTAPIGMDGSISGLSFTHLDEEALEMPRSAVVPDAGAWHTLFASLNHKDPLHRCMQEGEQASPIQGGDSQEDRETFDPQHHNVPADRPEVVARERYGYMSKSKGALPPPIPETHDGSLITE